MASSTDAQPTRGPSTDGYPLPSSTLPLVRLKEYVPDRELLKKFCEANQCDFELVSGTKNFIEYVTFADSYEVIMHPSQIGDAASPPIAPTLSAICVNRPKRFSNSLAQVGNAIIFARQNGVKLLILNDFWYLPKGYIKFDDSLCILNVGKDAIQNIPGPILSGLFFYQKSIRHLYPLKCEKRYFTLRPLEKQFLLTPSGAAFPEDELVIYIRSGDVFTRANGANPNYGQPPLAFYQLLIVSRRWQKLHLVYENKANPVIPELEGYLAKAKIAFDVQSGTLQEDIQYLLRAKSLVAARGSFISGVVSISPNVQNLFYFDKNYVDWGRSVKKHRILDTSGEYIKAILSTNWKNEPWQRQLMVDYPIHSLQAES